MTIEDFILWMDTHQATMRCRRLPIGGASAIEVSARGHTVTEAYSDHAQNLAVIDFRTKALQRCVMQLDRRIGS